MWKSVQKKAKKIRVLLLATLLFVSSFIVAEPEHVYAAEIKMSITVDGKKVDTIYKPYYTGGVLVSGAGGVTLVKAMGGTISLKKKIDGAHIVTIKKGTTTITTANKSKTFTIDSSKTIKSDAYTIVLVDESKNTAKVVFPLDALCDAFGYAHTFDEVTGVYAISTTTEKPAESEWFYISPLGQSAATPSVYKVKKDGTDFSVVFPYYDGSAISSVLEEKDDWVYFYSRATKTIYKIKTDGTDFSKLVSAGYEFIYNADVLSPDFNIVGDWAYYGVQNYDNTYSIRRVRLTAAAGDDAQSTELSKGGFVAALCAADDGYIYYYGHDETNNTYNIYKMKNNGTGKQLLIEDVEGAGDMHVCDGWLYYVNYDYTEDITSICKIKTDGTGKTVVSSKNMESPVILKIENGVIFYRVYSEIYKMDTDGSAQIKVVDTHFTTNSENVLIDGDTAYILSPNVIGTNSSGYTTVSSTIYKIPLKGKTLTKVATFNVAGAGTGSTSTTVPATPSTTTAPATTTPTITPQPCFNCKGEGMAKCSGCDGTGQLMRSSKNPIDCHACGATGKILCGICFGSGTAK